MQYRIDEKSGNSLSVLGFGCMRFPKSRGNTDYEKSEELVLRAVENGVNYFDTAYMYPQSEETLGKIITANSLRDKIYLATKLPLVLIKKPYDIEKYFLRQLEQLQTDYIDYYLMHMLIDMRLWESLKSYGIRQWITDKKASGKIKNVGFSFHGSREDFLKLLDAYDWDFCQIQYNYSDENYQAGVTGLRAAYEKGIPVIIMEPLLGGKLINALPEKAVSLFKTANPDLSLAARGLRWLLNQKEVTCILSGMNTLEQLYDNVETSDNCPADSLSEDELTLYDEVINIFRKANKIPCTGCGYCLPCPNNVNIPSCFAAYNACYTHSYAYGLRLYAMSTGGFSKTSGAARRCIKCGKCERHCPQKIAIRSELDKVKRKLETPPYRFAMAVARRVMGR